MPDKTTTVAELRQLVDEFVGRRDWHQFHTPKNLAMALAIEAAELMEHFQWLDQAESRAVAHDAAKRAAAGEELADVVCYALAMANELGLDSVGYARRQDAKERAKVSRRRVPRPLGAGDERTPGG